MVTRVCPGVQPAMALVMAVLLAVALPSPVASDGGEHALVKEGRVEPAVVQSMARLGSRMPDHGGADPVPVPESATVCGLPLALSATLTFALRLPVVNGVKV